MFIPPYNPRSWPLTGLSCLKNEKDLPHHVSDRIGDFFMAMLLACHPFPPFLLPHSGTSWSHDLDERGNGCGGLQAAATLTVHLGSVGDQAKYGEYMGNMISKWVPIGSMYGIYANIGGILMVNVTIYSIHGSYGVWTVWTKHWGMDPQKLWATIHFGWWFNFDLR